jgi:hypothetical protein
VDDQGSNRASGSGVSDKPKLHWYSFRWRWMLVFLLVLFSPLIWIAIADILHAYLHSEQ